MLKVAGNVITKHFFKQPVQEILELSDSAMDEYYCLMSLLQSLFSQCAMSTACIFIKSLGHGCFAVKVAKFFKRVFLLSTSWQLLLQSHLLRHKLIFVVYFIKKQTSTHRHRCFLVNLANFLWFSCIFFSFQTLR